MIKKGYLLICVLLMSVLFGCDEEMPDDEVTSNIKSEEVITEDQLTEETTNKPYLYGLGEPLINSNVISFDTFKSIDLIGALGAKSFRMWVNPSDVFNGWQWNKETPDAVISNVSKNTAALFHEVFFELEKAGVEEITGMSHFLPVTNSTATGSGHLVPHFDSPDYQVFLNKVKLGWKTLAKTFPEITIWEVGNETNHSFMEYADREMLYSERARVTVDLMYYARLGIKEGNPEAIAITPGFAPVTSYLDDDGYTVRLNNGIDSITDFMKLIYQYIASGSYPTGMTADTNPDHYFDGVAWHPYDLGKYPYANTNDPKTGEFDVKLWVDANNRCYQVMCDNGDSAKEVWFTEFGLTSKEASLVVTNEDDKDITIYNVNNKFYKTTKEYEQRQADYVKEYFKAMESSSMSYVHACHFFRLYGCTLDYSCNGFTVLYYGMFFEPSQRLDRGFYPRTKAYTIQEIYGGKGDLLRYFDWELANN